MLFCSALVTKKKLSRAESFSEILTNFSKKYIYIHGKVKQVKQKLVTALIIWDQFS